jgi:hypothetical protein
MLASYLAVNAHPPRVPLISQYSRNHIRHQLRRRGHCSLEEVYNNAIEPLSQCGVPPERLLDVTGEKSAPHTSQKDMRTHNLAKQLSQDSDQLVVHQLATFQRGIFEAFDLLLHDDLKRGRADEQCRCGSLKRPVVSERSPRLEVYAWSSITEELYKMVRMSPSLT